MSQSHLLCQQKLHEILQSLLPLFEKGISEYELITLLSQAPHGIFNALTLSNSLLLFQTHFILFHALYKLRNQWRASDIGQLDIIATNIKLNPSVEKYNNNALDTHDLLAEYYLDWRNFTNADKAEVNQLLASFWVKMSTTKTITKHSAKTINDALSILEIGDSNDGNIYSAKGSKNKQNIINELSIEQLKSQYRKLQHRHHPDKGGSAQKAQLVLQAYEFLREHLERNDSNSGY